MRTMLVLLALVALAGAAWHFRDTPALAGLWPAPAGTPAVAPRATGAPAQGGHGTVHKCVAGETVTYTDGPCPGGSQKQALQGGAVTVLPAAPKAAAAPASAPPNVRDLLIKPGEVDIKERRMDAVIGK